MATHQWIKNATSNSHGQFRAKAQKAGMSTGAFASKVLKAGSTASTKTKKQASLAKTLMRLGK